MEYKAVQKYLRTSPTKIRGVAKMILRKNPREAIETLPFSQKRSAFELIKVIKQALANAVSSGAGEQSLFIKEIQVNEGPRLKRGRPVSRGRWHPYKKRMSHIRVVIGTNEEKVSKVQTKNKDNTENQTVGKSDRGKKVNVNNIPKKVSNKKTINK